MSDNWSRNRVTSYISDDMYYFVREKVRLNNCTQAQVIRSAIARMMNDEEKDDSERVGDSVQATYGEAYGASSQRLYR